MPTPAVDWTRPGRLVGVTRRRHLLDGTAWGLLAEALALPTGLATVAFLTRALGVADYGRYTLTVGLIMVLQGGIASLLSRASIKFVSQAEDWRPVGTSVLRLHLGIGLAMAFAVTALAPTIAALLGEPSLAGFLRLLAWVLPAESVAQGHLHILVAQSSFRRRATARAVFWGSRLLLIVGLVSAGLGVNGALVGLLGASLATVIVARMAIRPTLLGPGAPIRPLLAFAIPLFVSGTAVVLSKRLDLFALKLLGGSVGDVGLYASAQTLAFLPGMLNTAFAPLLLSSINQAYHKTGRAEAASLSRDFMRGAFWLLPFAGMAAGAAAEICAIAYGTEYAAAGAALALLVFAGVTTTLGATVSALLVVADDMRAILWTALVPLLVAVLCFPVLIPRWGMPGAAASTLAGSMAGLAIGLVIAYRTWGVAPPLATVARAVLLATLAFGAARAWVGTGAVGVVVLALLTLAIPVLFFLLGESSRAEIAAMRQTLGCRFGRGEPPQKGTP